MHIENKDILSELLLKLMYQLSKEKQVQVHTLIGSEKSLLLYPPGRYSCSIRHRLIIAPKEMSFLWLIFS